jgi:hypothetical protein
MTMTSLANGTTSTLRLGKNNWAKGWEGDLAELTDEMLNGLCEVLYSNIIVAARIGPKAIWSSIRFIETFAEATKEHVQAGGKYGQANLRWDFIEALELQQFEKGETIYLKGEEAIGAYFLFEGQVAISTEGRARKQYIEIGGTFGVGGASAGHIFGESTRACTAVAQKHSTLLICPVHDFDALCCQYRGAKEAMESCVRAHVNHGDVKRSEPDVQVAKKSSKWGKVNELAQKIVETKRKEEQIAEPVGLNGKQLLKQEIDGEEQTIDLIVDVFGASFPELMQEYNNKARSHIKAKRASVDASGMASFREQLNQSQKSQSQTSTWEKGGQVEVVLKGADFGKMGTVDDPDWYGHVLVSLTEYDPKKGCEVRVTKGFSSTDLLIFNRNAEWAMRRKHRYRTLMHVLVCGADLCFVGVAAHMRWLEMLLLHRLRVPPTTSFVSQILSR